MTRRTCAGSTCAVLITLVLATAYAQAATQEPSPLDTLIKPVEDASACFRRDYDERHLRQHAKQKTKSVVIWLNYQKADNGLILLLGLAMIRRGDAQPLFSSGSCAWVAGGNRDIKDRPVIDVFKRKTGGNCAMSARPDVFDTLSAEEGGELIIDTAKPDVILYTDTALAMVTAAARDKPIGVEFGSEDRVFRLHPTAIKDCDFVQRALTR
jgi:hypothetical protein